MMIDEKPYIKYDNKLYQCYLAGYTNPVQHKWSFVISGIDSGMVSGEKIAFFDMTLTVTYTERRENVVSKPMKTGSNHETYIEAWMI